MAEHHKHREKGDIVSTGRGGAGNIGSDSTVYVDGGIIREGPEGSSGRPNASEYSAGRGGAGNIEPTPHNHRPAGETADDVIPEPAMTERHYEDFHTGRGGQGNIHRDKYDGHTKPQKEKGEHGGLMEKAKHAVGMDKREEK